MSYTLLAGMLRVTGYGHRPPDLLYKATHPRLVDEARVHFAYARPFDNLPHVTRPYPTTRHDHDPSPCQIDQLGYHVRTLESGGFSTRSQDAGHADVDQLFEPAPAIDYRVECAMEGDWKPIGRLNESARFGDGNAAFWRQGAGDNPRSSQVTSCLDIRKDRLDFIRRVDEVSRAGPDQNEDRKLDGGGDRGNQFRRWSRAALIEIYAQLEAIGATAVRGQRGFKTLDRGFNERQYAPFSCG